MRRFVFFTVTEEPSDLFMKGTPSPESHILQCSALLKEKVFKTASLCDQTQISANLFRSSFALKKEKVGTGLNSTLTVLLFLFFLKSDL